MNLQMPSITRNLHLLLEEHSTKRKNSTRLTDSSPLNQSDDYLFLNHMFQPTLKTYSNNSPLLQRDRIHSKDISAEREYYSLHQSPNIKISQRKFAIFKKPSFRTQTSQERTSTSLLQEENKSKQQKMIISRIIGKLSKKNETTSKSPVKLQTQKSNSSNKNFSQFKQNKVPTLAALDCVSTFDNENVKFEDLSTLNQLPQKSTQQLNVEKMIEKRMIRKETIFLPQIIPQDEKYSQKIEVFRKRIFKNQCTHMIYIRPSAIRVQKYIVKDYQNQLLVKKIMKYRWWWQISDDTQNDIQFCWGAKPIQEYLEKQKIRNLTDKIIHKPFAEIVKLSEGDIEDQMKFAQDNDLILICPFIKSHNHFDTLFQFSKCSLIQQIQLYCSLFDIDYRMYLPFSLVVKSVADDEFIEFMSITESTNNYWIVQQCNKSIIPKIKICSSKQSVLKFIKQQYSIPNRKHQQFIVQEHVKSIQYQNSNVELNCYFLITQISGIIRTYLFKKFSIQESGLNFSEFENDSYQQYIDYLDEDNLCLKIDGQTYFNDQNINFDQDIFPQLQEIFFNYSKSLYNLLIYKDFNFELFQATIIIDNNIKAKLINIKQKLDLTSDFSEQLLDNVFQLSLDILFPCPSIWPKNKKSQIETFYEQNLFHLLFDSRLDSNGLIQLYNQINQQDIYYNDV